MKTLFKNVILVICLLFTANILKSQSISDILSNTDLNYFQIQEQLHSNKAILDSASERELKHYKPLKIKTMT